MGRMGLIHTLGEDALPIAQAPDHAQSAALLRAAAREAEKAAKKIKAGMSGDGPFSPDYQLGRQHALEDLAAMPTKVREELQAR